MNNISSGGAILSYEWCVDGSYVVAKRTNSKAATDMVVAEGALHQPLSTLRRADVTRVLVSIGEVPFPVPAPGSNGTEVTDPASDPAQGLWPTPTSTPEPTLTSPPSATSTPEPTVTPTASPTPTGSGFATGMSALLVLGQADFTGGASNRGGSVGANTLATVDGIDFDGTRLAIADRNNNRVLLYDSLPTAHGAAADHVLGQTSFTSTTTGCTDSQISGPRGVGLADGKVFVSAALHHRVMIWNSWPTEDGLQADIVLGQPNLTSCTSNNGGLSARSFDSWFALGLFARPGQLYVGDHGNNRVLVFNAPYSTFMDASLVLGQADFTTIAASANADNRFAAPPDAYGDDSVICIPDRLNNRVLLYTTPPVSNGASADFVLGQADFTTTSNNRGGSVAANTMSGPHACVHANGHLFVADSENNRVLIWENLPTTNGQAPDVVLGQADFVSGGANRGGSPAADTLRRPTAIRYKNGMLFVADQQNHRVLVYRSAHLQ